MILEAIETIKNSPRDSYETGVEASFKKINEKWGLKFYDNESIRDKTYELQGMAYEIGCAPELGGKFEMNIGDEKIYGYITECANMLIEQDEDGYYPDIEDQDVLSQDILDQHRMVINKCAKIMRVSDIHCGNFGLLNDGRLVIIDFSRCDPWDKYYG